MGGFGPHAGQGPERPYHPFFSPDGQWLGFVTLNAMKKMPISGGTPIKLTDVRAQPRRDLVSGRHDHLHPRSLRARCSAFRRPAASRAA